MTSAIDLILEAKLREEVVSICLHSDLNEQWTQADRELREAQAITGASLEPSEELRTLAQRVVDIEDQMAKKTIRFRLRALPSAKFRALAEQHPPRRDDEGNANPRDLRMGFNAETYFPALLRASVVDPELPDDVWATFLEKITDRQWEQLTTAAFAVNREDVDVPFSLAASRLIPRSATDSKPLNGSVSAANGSTGGSPEASPSTSTETTDG